MEKELLKGINFLEITNKLPSRYRHFIFLDTLSCHANNVFIKFHVPVNVKETWSRKPSPYHFVVCDVPKKDVNNFIKAMSALRDNMLLLGTKTYEEDCKALFKELLSNIE